MSSNSILSWDPFFNPVFSGIDLLSPTLNPDLCNFGPFSLNIPNEGVEALDFPEEKNKKDEKPANFIIKKFTNKKRYESSGLDNIKKKIQGHFFSFIIDISNDALLTLNKKRKSLFKRIDYKEKQKCNYKEFEKLKKSSIKKVIKMNISPKFTKKKKNYNKKLLAKLLAKISNKPNWLDKFFDMNYMKLFNYYYNNKKPLTKIIFEGNNIELSEKTKCFYYLLEKNPKDKNKLINTITNDYFYGYDTLFFLQK